MHQPGSGADYTVDCDSDADGRDIVSSGVFYVHPKLTERKKGALPAPGAASGARPRSAAVPVDPASRRRPGERLSLYSMYEPQLQVKVKAEQELEARAELEVALGLVAAACYKKMARTVSSCLLVGSSQRSPVCLHLGH